MSKKIPSRGLMIELKFKGPKSKLEKAIVDLGKTWTSDVEIGTWPTPERPEKSNPGRELTIELKFKGPKSKLEKATLDLGKSRISLFGIGTWPTPE